MAHAFMWVRGPLDDERRAMLPIQIVTRWILVAIGLLVVNFHPRADTALQQGELNVLIAAAAGFNLLFHWRLIHRAAIPAVLPVVSGLLDMLAIIAALRLIEGFDNLNFVMFYPELLAFTLLFPGLPSAGALALTVGAYVGLVATHEAFEPASVQDWKDLAARVITLGATVAIANLAVSIERGRRLRATNAAVAAHIERERVSREIHDGVAQGVYMLALNLEANAHALDDDPERAPLRERLVTLTEIAKQTLLETRGLLYDLQPVMAGEKPLDELLHNLAREFSVVTGVESRVTADEGARTAFPELPPWAVAEIYRVVQEALANVFKHAEARSVYVHLSGGVDGFGIEVSDDGKGFDVDEAGQGHGLGNQRARAARLGGQVEIDSADGRGTRVALRFPRTLPAGG
jgi:signal transduction histidine kinase